MTSSADTIDLTADDDDDDSPRDQLDEEPEDYNGYFVDPVAGEEEEEDEGYYGRYFQDPVEGKITKSNGSVAHKVSSSCSCSKDVIDLVGTDDENHPSAGAAREMPPAKETLKQAIAKRTGQKKRAKKPTKKATTKKQQATTKNQQINLKAPSTKKPKAKPGKAKQHSAASKSAEASRTQKDLTGKKRKAEPSEGIASKKKAKTAATTKEKSHLNKPSIHGAKSKNKAPPKKRPSKQKTHAKTNQKPKAPKNSQTSNNPGGLKKKAPKKTVPKKKAATKTQKSCRHGRELDEERNKQGTTTVEPVDGHYGPAHEESIAKSNEDECERLESKVPRDPQKYCDPVEEQDSAHISWSSAKEPQELRVEANQSHVPAAVAGAWLCPTCRRTNASEHDYCQFCRPVLAEDFLNQTATQNDQKLNSAGQASDIRQELSSTDFETNPLVMKSVSAKKESDRDSTNQLKSSSHCADLLNPCAHVDSVEANHNHFTNSEQRTFRPTEPLPSSSHAHESLAGILRSRMVSNNEHFQSVTSATKSERQESIKSDPEPRKPLEPPGEVSQSTSPKEVTMREKACIRSDPQGSYADPTEENSISPSSGESLMEFVKQSWLSKGSCSEQPVGELNHVQRAQVDPPSTNTPSRLSPVQTSLSDHDTDSLTADMESDDDVVVVDDHPPKSSENGELPTHPFTGFTTSSKSDSTVKLEGAQFEATGRDVGNPAQETTGKSEDVKLNKSSHNFLEKDSPKAIPQRCNFVIIDDSSEDEEDDPVCTENRWSKRWSNRSSTVKPPKRKQVVKQKEYSHGFSFEAAQAEQERLFQAAAARVRLMGLANARPVRTTAAPGLPVISTPIADIEKKYPHHWKWKDPYFRLGLPRVSNFLVGALATALPL